MNIMSRIFAVTLLAFSCATSTFADDSTIIFKQTPIPNIVDSFSIPKVNRTPPPFNKFSLVLWQQNPKRADGQLEPSSWDAGEKTGLHVAEPRATYQLSFQNKAGSTTIQAWGDSVGAYLNSDDLPADTHKNKMMVAPQFSFPKKQGQVLIKKTGDKVEVSLDLQVPTARDHGQDTSNTYVNSDLLFSDLTSNTRISFGCNLFKLGKVKLRENVGFDEDSGNIMVNAPLYEGGLIYKPLPDSATHSSSVWSGWRHYDYFIDYDSFASALKMVKEKYPQTSFSTNPSDYEFVKFHLNAELHFASGSAELGWSMRNAQVTSQH